jgi:CheY-like chemotaxis protein
MPSQAFVFRHRPVRQAPSSINTASKSALLVESDESLLTCFRQLLEKAGYVVRLAPDTGEGLRLFRECGPFNVVLINYYAPEKKGTGIDCLVPQIHGVRLAVTIRDMNPSQGIIIVALDYQFASDVPRPAEVAHIAVLVETGNGHPLSPWRWNGNGTYECGPWELDDMPFAERTALLERMWADWQRKLDEAKKTRS